MMGGSLFPRYRSGVVACSVPAVLVLLVACGAEPRHDPGRPYFDLVERLRIATHGEGGPPASDAGSGSLLLQAGAWVAYPVLLEPSSRLRAAGLVIEGDTRLVIEIETDAGGSDRLGVFGSSTQDPDLEIDLAGETPALVTLRAEAGEGGGEVRLRRPALWAPVGDPRGSEEVSVATSVAARENVLVYLIDTLRRDHLGSYGYSRPTSPHLDAFAARATLFADPVGQSSWTKPSVASLFAGVWPPRHGATGWRHVLPESFDTLAEVLRSQGYRTAAFVANPHINKAFGFTQGFDEFTPMLKETSAAINDRVFAWLENRNESAPFFAYLHSMDPHAPYNPPEPHRSRLAPRADEMPPREENWKWPVEARDLFVELYDAEIAFADSSFGALVAKLEALGLYDDTLIVVLSDHGEEFKEHGRWRHGRNLYAETLDFPLIVKFPQQTEPRRIELPAQHIDVMPTILGHLGIAPPAGAEGRDFSRLGVAVAGGEGLSAGPVFSHLRLSGSPLMHSLTDSEWKLIRSRRAGNVTLQLFDRTAEAREQEDLAGEFPVRAAVLDSLLTLELQKQIEEPTAERVDLEPQLREDLKALGYLD